MTTKIEEKHAHWFELDLLNGRMQCVLSMIMTTALAATVSGDTNSNLIDAIVGIGDHLESLLEELGNTVENMRNEAIKSK